MAQEALSGLDAGVAMRQRELVRVVENLWDKYRPRLDDLQYEREKVQAKLFRYLGTLGYDR